MERIPYKGLLLIASLVALGFLAKHLALSELLTQNWIDHTVRGKGITGEALFLSMGALATALSVPRQVVAFLAGYAFGFVMGSVLALCAALMGCVLGFYYARWLGRSLIQRRFPQRIAQVDRFLGQHPFTMALVIRLLPVGNNALTNLLAGVSSVRFPPFLAGSALGYIPQTLVFALAGSGVHFDPMFRLSLATLLLLISGLLGGWLYRRHRPVVQTETKGLS
jgi:uncharacterized membrane protein YdjX (TVP38/TMEM64 family)